MSEVATKDAYAQGVDAGMRGFAASDNPYEPVEEHDAYAAWNEGYYSINLDL